MKKRYGMGREKGKNRTFISDILPSPLLPFYPLEFEGDKIEFQVSQLNPMCTI